MPPRLARLFEFIFSVCLHACVCVCVCLCHGTHVVVGKQLLGVPSRLSGECQGLSSSCPWYHVLLPTEHFDSPWQKTLKYYLTLLLTPLESLRHPEDKSAPIASWLFPECRLKCTRLQMAPKAWVFKLASAHLPVLLLWPGSLFSGQPGFLLLFLVFAPEPLQKPVLISDHLPHLRVAGLSAIWAQPSFLRDEVEYSCPLTPLSCLLYLQ